MNVKKKSKASPDVKRKKQKGREEEVPGGKEGRKEEGKEVSERRGRNRDLEKCFEIDKVQFNLDGKFQQGR